jgi:hypothetical protein
MELENVSTLSRDFRRHIPMLSTSGSPFLLFFSDGCYITGVRSIGGDALGRGNLLQMKNLCI